MALCILVILATAIEWTPTGSTVSVLTRMKKEYGLTRETSRDLVEEFLDARANGNLDGFGEFLETLYTDSQLKQLRSYSFQCSLGSGLLSRALRLNRIELTEQQRLAVKQSQAKSLEEARLHDIDDCHEIGEWILSPIIAPDKLRSLEGSGVKWLSRRRKTMSIVSVHDTVINGEPIDIINWAEIAAELQLSPAQMSDTSLLKKKHVDMNFHDEGDENEDLDWVGYDLPKGKTYDEVSLAIYRDVTEVLNEDQLTRFNQMLLQRYVATCPPFAVPHLRLMGHPVDGSNATFKKRCGEYDNSVYAIRHFRRMQYMLPAVKEFMDERLVAQLIKPRFIPVKDGRKPNLEAAIFATLSGVKQRKSENPRRER